MLELRPLNKDDIVVACRLRMKVGLSSPTEMMFYEKFIGSYDKLELLMHRSEEEIVDTAMYFLKRIHGECEQAATAIIDFIVRAESNEQQSGLLLVAESQNDTSALTWRAFDCLQNFELPIVEGFFSQLVLSGEYRGVGFGAQRRELAAIYLLRMLGRGLRGDVREEEMTGWLLEEMELSDEPFVRRGLMHGFNQSCKKEYGTRFAEALMRIALGDSSSAVRDLAFDSLRKCEGEEVTRFLIDNIGEKGERYHAVKALLRRRDPSALAYFKEMFIRGEDVIDLHLVLEMMEYFECEEFNVFLLMKVQDKRTPLAERKKICDIFCNQELINSEAARILWNVCVRDEDADVARAALHFFTVMEKEDLENLLFSEYPVYF